MGFTLNPCIDPWEVLIGMINNSSLMTMTSLIILGLGWGGWGTREAQSSTYYWEPLVRILDSSFRQHDVRR